MVFEQQAGVRIWWKFALAVVWIAGVVLTQEHNSSDLLTVDIKIASSTTGIIQVFADDGKNFREDLSVLKQITPSLDVMSHRFVLKAPIGLKTLRFDPLNVPGTVRIEQITISYYGLNWKFTDENFSNWRIARQLVALPSASQSGRSFQVTGSDPVLLLDLPEDVHTISFSQHITSSVLSALSSIQVWLLIVIGVGIILISFHVNFWYVNPLPANMFLHLSVACTLVLIFWSIYYPALDNGFSFDDPIHMLYLLDHGIWSPFFDPENSGSRVNFTPLYFSSYGLDVNVFGLMPHGYYWHHLISFSLTLGLVYFVLIHFMSPITSFMALLMFVMSVVGYSLTNMLMTRHYIEGMGLSAAALLCFIYALKYRKLSLSIIGSLFYFLATLTKELYVPLIGLLPFMAIAHWRTRWLYVLPYCVIAILYVVWRIYIIGFSQVIAGYNVGTSLPDLNVLFTFPVTYTQIMHFSTFHIVFICIGIALCFWHVLKHWQHRLMFFLTTIVCTVVPFIPVLNILAPRYVTVFTLMLFIAMFWGTEQVFSEKTLLKRFFILLFSLIFLLGSFYPFKQHDNTFGAELDQFKSESNFLMWQSQEGDFMLSGTNPNSIFLPPYLLLRERHDLPGKGQLINQYDLCQTNNLQLTGLESGRYFEYNQSQMVEKTRNTLLGRCQQPTFQFDIDKPLYLKLTRPANVPVLLWEFGPYADKEGQYFLIYHGLHLPLAKQTQMLDNFSKIVDAVTLRVIYRHQSGWQTISPLLTVPLIGTEESHEAVHFEWQRD